MQISDKSEHIEAPPLSASFNHGICRGYPFVDWDRKVKFGGNANHLFFEFGTRQIRSGEKKAGYRDPQEWCRQERKLAHQRNVAQNGYTGFSQKPFRRRFGRSRSFVQRISAHQ